MRAPGTYDVDEASNEAGLLCRDDSRAIQSQKDEADINVIVKRFGISGELPLTSRVPLDIDVDELLDYRTCLDRVRQADAAFASLPADLRSRFDNEPAKFVAFCEDDGNREEAVKLGLIPAPLAPPEPPPSA